MIRYTSLLFDKLKPVTLIGAPLSFELGGGLLRFAHHPHCNRHIHHLIWIRGRPLCLGCTAMAIGVPIGLVAAASISWANVSLPLWILGHTLFIAPTAAQPFIQKKSFKIVARVSLGAASASYFLSGMVLQSYFLNTWLWRSCVLLAFATGFMALFKLRQRRINNPCNNCPLGVFPTCDWNMPRLLAQNDQDPLWIKIKNEPIIQTNSEPSRKSHN
jgi:hypothetical protein